MPVCYKSIDHVERTAESVEYQKEQLKRTINEAIDQLLEDEIEYYHLKQASEPRGFQIMSYIRGLYYLTFARFTNPVAYRMAWQVINKLNEDHSE